MKRFFYLPVILLTLFASACGDDKDNEPTAPSTPETTLSVSPSSLSLLSDQNAQVSFNIRSNTDWTITEIPEWVNLSATSGNGDASIMATTLSANASDEARTATLKISTGQNEEGTDGLSTTVTLSQMAKYQANCRVEFTNIFLLATSMCFDIETQDNVSYFYIGKLSASASGWTDAKIIQTLTAEGETALTPDDTAVAFGTDNVDPDTEYYLCAVGFDAQGNQGPLTKTKVRSLKLQNNYPWVYIDDIEFLDNAETRAYFRKSTATLGYYTYALVNTAATTAYIKWCVAMMAQTIKKSIDNGDLTLWPNDSWLYWQGNYDAILVNSWGIDALSQLSPVINFKYKSKDSSSSAPRRVATGNSKSSEFVRVSKREIEDAAKHVIRLRR